MSLFGTPRNKSKLYSTRRTVNVEDENRKKEYTGDTDPDDLAELYINQLLEKRENNMPISYQFVVSMLMLIYYKNDFLKNIKNYSIKSNIEFLIEKIDEDFEERINQIVDKFTDELSDNEKLEEFEKYFTKENLISILIDNIENLLNISLKSPSPNKLGINDSITLYSGRSGPVGEIMILNLEYINSINLRTWYTPTFISSSLTKDTAIRFTQPIGRNRQRHVLVFTIPENRLKYFPFNSLYERTITFPQTERDTTRENEVLIAPYMKFAYLGPREPELVNYREPTMGKYIKKNTETVIYHDLVFIDYADKLLLEEDISNDEKIGKISESGYINPNEVREELKNLFLKDRDGGSKKTRKKKNRKKPRKNSRKKTCKKSSEKKNRKKRSVKKISTPNLLEQIKDNDWMNKILIKKANGIEMSDYEKFLYNAMISQPLPKGGINLILKKYKGKKLPSNN